MTEKPIPFSSQEAPGLEPLAGAGIVSMNVIRDPTGAVRRRPAIATYGFAPSVPFAAGPITGLRATERGQLFAVADNGAERTIYISGGGVQTAVGGGFPPAGLRGTSRPVFAETEALLVIAGGQELQKIELLTLLSDRLGGNPPFATHVIAQSGRLLVNTIPPQQAVAAFSGIAAGTITYAGHEQWTNGVGNAGFISAEGRPDPIVAVHENTNEVFVFGTTTLQVFAPDSATLPFAPVSTREHGCSAPYSIIKVDQTFAWLDDFRRFIVSDGRSDQVISEEIEGVLDEMATVDDCFGYRVNMGHYDILVWTFPADGRTFTYQKGVGWGQWSGAGNGLFPVTAHTQRGNVNVIGTSAGFVGMLSLATQLDLGETIRAYVETGYSNRGTDRQKHCRSVRLGLKRGRVTGATAPVAFLRFRDRPGPWSNPMPVSLGISGDTDIVVPFHSLGVYRRRQWSFEFTGANELVLVSATEDFEELEN